MGHGVLLTAHLLREDRGQEIVGAHALQVGRHLLAPHVPQQGQRALAIPAPPDLEHRGQQRGRGEGLLDGRGREKLEDRFQREAVLRAEREQHRVVGGRRLELEVEGLAERLAQGQPEAAVEPRAEGGMHDQLHAAGLVEESVFSAIKVFKVGRAPSAARASIR